MVRVGSREGLFQEEGDGFLGNDLGGLQFEVGLLGGLVGGVDAGEFLDRSGAGLLMQISRDYTTEANPPASR